MMRHPIVLLALLGLSACTPSAPEAEPTLPEHPALTHYEASEFEPNWSLKLIGGEILTFTQLDPVAGNDLVTYTYWVDGTLADSGGWVLYGSGEEGDFALNIIREQACTHSGSGYTHRDTVNVTISDQQEFKGCGGPVLDEP